jgi:hypothetical protein
MGLTSASIAAEGGCLRISDVNRATFSTLLVEVLPAEEASHNTIRATRKITRRNPVPLEYSIK